MAREEEFLQHCIGGLKQLVVRFSTSDLKKDQPRGVLPGESKWGGYVAEFKLIAREKYVNLNGDIDTMRRESIVTGPLQRRTFRIELSKHEFCKGKAEKELEDYTVYVYTPEMIMIEKLRAICQQMPEYTSRGYKTARARDFYDIHTLATEGKIDIADAKNLALAKDIFAAKDVPITLIAEIPKFKEFHRPDWPSVEAAVTGEIESYDYYFDYVVAQTLRMKSLWVEESPK